MCEYFVLNYVNVYKRIRIQFGKGVYHGLEYVLLYEDAGAAAGRSHKKCLIHSKQSGVVPHIWR